MRPDETHAVITIRVVGGNVSIRTDSRRSSVGDVGGTRRNRLVVTPLQELQNI
jgi:hypothetical protein